LNDRIIGRWLAAAVYLGACVPIALILWQNAQGTLSADPIREAQLRTGRWALAFLLASLAGTPLARLTGWRPLLALRRSFGLAAFAYALMHFVNFVWLDYGFNFTFLGQDLFTKQYAVAGFAAFLLMLPTLVGSFPGMARRFGPWWPRLRWLIYAAAIVAVVHLIWSIKVEAYTRAIVYAAILGVLLVLRLPGVNRLVLRWGS